MLLCTKAQGTSGSNTARAKKMAVVIVQFGNPLYNPSRRHVHRPLPDSAHKVGAIEAVQ